MKKAELIDKIIELKKKGFPIPKIEKYVKPKDPKKISISKSGTPSQIKPAPTIYQNRSNLIKSYETGEKEMTEKSFKIIKKRIEDAFELDDITKNQKNLLLGRLKKLEPKKPVTKKPEPKKQKTLKEKIAEVEKEIEKEKERIYKSKKAGGKPKETKLRELKKLLIDLPLFDAVEKKVTEASEDEPEPKKPEPKKAGGGIKPKKPEVSEQKLLEIQMSLGHRTYAMENILRNVNDNKLSKGQMAKLKKTLPRYKEFEEDVKLLEANAKPKSLAETYVKDYRKHMKIIENLEMPEKKKEELVPKLTKAEQDKLYGKFKPGDLFMNYDKYNEREYIYQLLHFKGRAGNKIMLGAVAMPETERNEKERKKGLEGEYPNFYKKDSFYSHFPYKGFKPIKLENLEKYKRITTPVTLSPHADNYILRRVIFKGSPLKKYTKKDWISPFYQANPQHKTDFDQDFVANTYY